MGANLIKQADFKLTIKQIQQTPLIFPRYVSEICLIQYSNDHLCTVMMYVIILVMELMLTVDTVCNKLLVKG